MPGGLSISVDWYQDLSTLAELVILLAEKNTCHLRSIRRLRKTANYVSDSLGLTCGSRYFVDNSSIFLLTSVGLAPISV